MIHPVALRQSYSFSLFTSAVLGNGFQQATVSASQMDFESAISQAPNIPIIHQQILPRLPEGTPQDPRDLTYMRLRLSSGEYRIIAHEWLRDTPIPVDIQVVVATIRVDKAEDTNVIRDALIAAGISSFTLEYQRKTS